MVQKHTEKKLEIIIKRILPVNRNILFLQKFFSLVQFKLIYFTSIEKQVLTTYTNLCQFRFLGTTPVLVLNTWANENPKVDTRSQEPNLGPYDCEADALPHDHGHHFWLKK